MVITIKKKKIPSNRIFDHFKVVQVKVILWSLCRYVIYISSAVDSYFIQIAISSRQLPLLHYHQQQMATLSILLSAADSYFIYIVISSRQLLHSNCYQQQTATSSTLLSALDSYFIYTVVSSRQLLHLNCYQQQIATVIHLYCYQQGQAFYAIAYFAAQISFLPSNLFFFLHFLPSY